MIIIILILIFLLIFLNIPVIFSIGFGCIVYSLFSDINPIVLPQRMFVTMDVFTFLSVPLFLFAANIMNKGGSTKIILDLANNFVGHIRGGLGQVNIVASMLFAGISGSAVADAAGLGKLEIEMMSDSGYDIEFSAAITLASSTIGPIIPPSIIMVIYGVTANVSIGALFLAGIIPGVLMGFSLMVMVYFIVKNKNYPINPKPTFKNFILSFFKAIPPLMIGIIILLGITGGIFTPSEAGAVACFYALILNCLIYKKINLNELRLILLDTILTTSIIMIVVAISGLFSWIITLERIPQLLVNGIFQITEDKIIILLLLNLLIIFLGCFLDAIPIILMLVPILIPLLNTLGIDLVHFGIIICVNTMIGLTTPPFGIGLYTVSGISGIKVERLAIKVFPFIIALIISLLIITIIPKLSLFLPNIIL